MNLGMLRAFAGRRNLEFWMLLLLLAFLVPLTIISFWNVVVGNQNPIEQVRAWAVFSSSICATSTVLYLQLNALREKRFAVAIVILFAVVPTTYIGTRYAQYMLLGLPSPPKVNPFLSWQPSVTLLAICALVSVAGLIYAIYRRGANNA
jgi:hypothetical protein